MLVRASSGVANSCATTAEFLPIKAIFSDVRSATFELDNPDQGTSIEVERVSLFTLSGLLN